MPKIKIDHIISFSSEDSVHVANNILSNNTSKKWKCQTPGERNAVVVLQLEKASVISGIDIGNEHSAYVEVLVSRSGMNEDYKVLLVTSSFMTPLEARQSQNINKVRMFNKEHFSKPECDEKWDRIKIVCTQPFNKHVQYGLSFINVHGGEDKVSTSTEAHIGKFILRPESPDNLSAGSLFEKRKQQKQEEKLTGAAAIREASSLASLALYGSPVCKPKLIIKNSSPSPSSRKDSLPDTSEEVSKPRNRNELLYSKDEEEPCDKIDKLIENKVKEIKEKELAEEKEGTPKQKVKQQESKQSNKKDRKDTQSPKQLDISVTTPSSSKKKDSIENYRKRKTFDEATKENGKKKPKKEGTCKPFSRLLEGVTIVISGIQNPDRGILRTHAAAMGAKYKSDWDNTCTHLICAFMNTPKFNQVKGKGKIVTRRWLENCYAQRKKLPWRRYALDKNDGAKEESEDEICEKIDSPESVKPMSDSDTDCDEDNGMASDTEDRVAEILKLQERKEKEGEKRTDIYSADTDEESPVQRIPLDITTELKNLFDRKTFYIDQSFEMELYNKLLKYITAYNGKPIDDPTENIDFIITNRQNSKSLKEVNAAALCLGPEWVWNCHNSQKLVPINHYVY